MNSATALTIETRGAAPNEEDRVFQWRCEELRRAGYGPEAASLLAAIPDIDLDRVIELRARRLRAA
jgi:hypothetical protein